MREVDVAFLSLALIAHDVDFVTGLEPGLALKVQNFRKRQHALGLSADVDDNVRAGELEHRAFKYFVLADRFFAFCREIFQSRSKVFGSGGLVFLLSV